MLKTRASKLIAALIGVVDPVVGLLNVFHIVDMNETELSATMIAVNAVGLGIIGVIGALTDPLDRVEE